MSSSNLGNLQSQKGATTADVTSAYKFKSGGSSTALIKNSEQSACTYSRSSKIWSMILTALIIFYILIIIILSLPVPDAVGYGLSAIEVVLLVIFVADVILSMRNACKKKKMVDSQIWSLMFRIQMLHLVAVVASVVLFLVGLMEIFVMDTEE